MKNIWLLFKGDIQRVFQNTITMLIIFGLVVIPSLFAWFNVIACWDVFDNTGNLKVAVANADEGYKSDLIPIKVNVGEQVLSELRANDQLEWIVTDVEDAIDGTRSGEYYAAVVIPETFSKDMMTFYSSDVEHATITYYSNEKKNAISPKVTDQGADKVSAEVNQVFVETLSEIGLGLSSSLLEYMDESDVQSTLGSLSTKVVNTADLVSQTSSALDSYASVLGVAQSLVTDSGDLISQVGASADDVISTAGDMKDTATSLADALDVALNGLSEALEKSAAGFDAVQTSIDNAFAAVGAQAADSSAEIRLIASGMDDQIDDYTNLVSSLETLKESLPTFVQPVVQSMIDRVHTAIDTQVQLRDALYGAADSIDAGSQETDAHLEEVRALAQQAQDTIAAAHADYDENIKPNLVYLSGAISDAHALLQQAHASLDTAETGLVGAADGIAGQLATAQSKLVSASADLKTTADKLKDLGLRINEALAGNDTAALREVLGSDPNVFATVLSAPVALDRQEVYPIENFGSAMTPLYTTLALWIGVLIMMVTLKMVPSRRIVDTLDHPTALQLFVGRFLIIALLSFLQSTLMCLGNTFFLRVQVSDILLYFICFWVSGLVFAFIVYTLVATFANAGKAIGVFLLIIQVSGGGGSYPLALLPQFVQAISPYLPVTHAVNAMRAAMFGVCNGDFWIEIGLLLLFIVPFFCIGVVLQKPLMGFVNAFVAKVESTKMM